MYEVSPEYNLIVHQLCAKFSEFTDVNAEQVIVFTSDKKSSQAIADIRRLHEAIQLLVPYKWMIICYRDMSMLSTEAKTLVLYHELRHIGIKGVQPHTLEDFTDMVTRWGPHWASRGDLPDILDMAYPEKTFWPTSGEE